MFQEVMGFVIVEEMQNYIVNWKYCELQLKINFNLDASYLGEQGYEQEKYFI